MNRKLALILWFVSWYTLKGEYFSHMQPQYKTYKECKVVCDSLNKVYLHIIHAPMHDYKKANILEATIGDYK